MEAKTHHFSAVSEYRESIVEYEANRSAVRILMRKFFESRMADMELNSLVLPRHGLKPKKLTMQLSKAR